MRTTIALTVLSMTAALTACNGFGCPAPGEAEENIVEIQGADTVAHQGSDRVQIQGADSVAVQGADSATGTPQSVTLYFRGSQAGTFTFAPGASVRVRVVKRRQATTP